MKEAACRRGIGSNSLLDKYSLDNFDQTERSTSIHHTQRVEIIERNLAGMCSVLNNRRRHGVLQRV